MGRTGYFIAIGISFALIVLVSLSTQKPAITLSDAWVENGLALASFIISLTVLILVVRKDIVIPFLYAQNRS
jgi:hypothetical protein